MRTTLRNLAIPACAFVMGLSMATAASAAMSREEHIAAKDRIEADYKAAKASCNFISGNAKDICLAEAKGKEKVAKAELEATYQPTEKNLYDVRVAKAEAAYDVAKEKCDDRAGDEKKICMKEAKAAETRAKADAKANRKTASAETSAAKKSYEAQRDAAEDKRDADYAVAKAKCDTLAGDAKDRCISDAKARYGKQ